MLSAFANSRRFIIVMEDNVPEGAGYFIYPQKEIGPYRADFYIEAVGWGRGGQVWPPNVIRKLVVECDGHDYHSTHEQIKYDNRRDEYMKEKGIDVLRFTGTEIVQQEATLAKEISKYLDNMMYS